MPDYSCISVGKIYDIFDSEGLTESNKSQSSVHGMEQTIDIAGRDFNGLCFTNLVDFDAFGGIAVIQLVMVKKLNVLTLSLVNYLMFYARMTF